MWFFFSGIVFFFWALAIIFLYYTKNASHLYMLGISNGNIPNIFPLLAYFGVIGIFYALYKFFISTKKSITTEYTLWQIFGVFLGQLFLTCFLFTNIKFQTESHSTWIEPNTFTLFFHILQFLFYPIFLVFLWRAIGASILYFLPTLSLPKKLSTMIEITLGMLIFSLAIFCLGFFKIFTLTNLIITLALLVACSYLGFKKFWQESKIIQIKSSPFSSYTISAEITILILNFVISVALISILRPMPIGWDDLGVYMNFPRIIAHIGGLLENSGMYVWQLITATGFLFHDNASQAFFINQIGGILATIAIISFLSLLLEKKNISKKYSIISLPIILGVIYYLMPMTVFQQAKDMKLDPALMFVSVTAFMTLFYAVKNFLKNNTKNALILFFLAGIFLGFAFSIKFTSLILIMAAAAYISHSFLGFFGLIGFSGVLIAIFTQGNLWNELYVWMPENTTKIVLSSGIIGIISLIFAFYSFRKNVTFFLKSSLILLLGILIPLLPWLGKHFLELQWNISIARLLYGSSSSTPSEHSVFYADHSKIFNETEIQNRQENNNYALATNDGVSLNEDFWRYFGQEKGLNNYIKLPANLTFQTNVGKEFTDITFIFLAFIPASLLFFGHTISNVKRRKIWYGGISFFLFLGILSIISTKIFSFHILTHFLTDITLPAGYLVLLALIFCFLWLVHFCLENGKIRGILVFLSIYGLVFWISAFGVVWYGVFLYFLLLVTLALAFQPYNSISENDNTDIKFFKKISAGIFYLFIGLYIFISAPLHAFANLKNATHSEYKYFALSQNSAIFIHKSDYFQPLVELNLKDPETIKEEIFEKFLHSEVKDDFEKSLTKEQSSLTDIHFWFLAKIQTAQQLSYDKNEYFQAFLAQKEAIQKNSDSPTLKNQKLHKLNTLHTEKQKSLDTEIQALSQEITIIDPIINEMYTKVLSPEKNLQNNDGIYRIGTFFTYFINNNRSRFYEDSLVTNFQTYFYDENPNITAERMKTMGLSYLLIDLNAPTIDKAELNLDALNNNRASLTMRHENLLSTIKDKRFSLISTDNICLRVAIDEYRAGNITTSDEFFSIAATNYDRYTVNENNVMNRISNVTTISQCAQYIKKLVHSENSYPYLNTIRAQKNHSNFEKILIQNLSRRSEFAVFKIND